MRRTAPLILASCLAVTTACGELGLVAYEMNGPVLSVVPSDSVDFLEAPPDGDGSAEEVTLISEGGVAVEVQEIYISGDYATDFALPNLDFLPLDLEPDKTLPMNVFFYPTAVGEFSAELVVVTNDSETPELFVGLTGSGCFDDNDDAVCD